MPKEYVHEIMKWVDMNSHPMLVQLTASDYTRLKAKWCLPAIDLGKWTASSAIGTTTKARETVRKSTAK
jgi:hypothetical protein